MIAVHQIVNGMSSWETAAMPIPSALRGYVRSWMGYSESSAVAGHRRELPGPQVVMIFEFGPPIRVSASGSETCVARYQGGFIAGVDDGFTITGHEGSQAGIQVNLSPLGAHALLGIPMKEITRKVVALPDLLPDARGIREKLGNAASWRERFVIVLEFLFMRLASGGKVHAPTAWAVEQIESSGGLVKVAHLTGTLGMSRKHLNALFQDQIGLSPKAYAGVVRFDGLANRIREDTQAAWTNLALDAGFADQAHMAREVRRYSGLSPTLMRALLREQAGLLPAECLPPDR